MADVVKLGQGIVFRPGTAHDERWAPNQFLSGFVTSINGNDASIVLFPDVYAPFYEMRVKRDDSLSEDRTWTPSVGESQTMPEAPADNQIYGRRNQAWTPISGEDQGYIQAVIIADSQPLGGLPGMAWFDTTINNFYLFEQGHWVEPGHVNPIEEISVNILPPLVTGSVAINELLSSTSGDWSSMPISYAYQWYRGPSPIPLQITNTYTIAVEDVDFDLTCVVTATNKIGVSQPASSNIISIKPPSNTELPIISGTVGLDLTLICSVGTWSNQPIIGYTYQWRRDGVDIVDEITAFHIIVVEDANTDLTCAVIASNAIGASTPAISNIVSAKTPVNTAAPLITGTIDVGSVLTCGTGTWANVPINFSYQWMRNGSPLSGETFNAYTLAVGDINTDISCSVTATNLVGSGQADSNTVFIGVPISTGAPVISAAGALFAGTTVSSSTGVWTLSPNSFTYQWNINGVAAAGATSNTFLLTNAHLTTNISCTVTATNAAGTSSPVTSNTLTVLNATSFDPATVLNTILEGINRLARHLNATAGGARSPTFRSSGKWLFSFDHTMIRGTATGTGLLLNTGSYTNLAAGTNCIKVHKNLGQIWCNNVNTGKVLGGLVDHDDTHWAVDMDNKVFWVRKNNGTWNGDAAAVVGVSGGLSFAAFGQFASFSPAVCFSGTGTIVDETFIAEFGQNGLDFSVPGFVPGWPT